MTGLSLGGNIMHVPLIDLVLGFEARVRWGFMGVVGCCLVAC